MNILASFYWDCGRQGEVDGKFICTEEEFYSLIDKEIYFGEILGKHSEIFGTIDKDDIKIISEDQEFIIKCLEIFGKKTISGYNPLNYLEQ